MFEMQADKNVTHTLEKAAEKGNVGRSNPHPPLAKAVEGG
jgi:hypothetical protein